MPWQPLVIVDILSEIVSAVDTVTYPTLNQHIFYYYGKPKQITAKIQALAQSTTLKDSWYPAIFVTMPFPEQLGTGYYAKTKFPQISIATLSNGTDDPMTRYTNTLKPILYLIYGELFRQFAKHPNVVGNDPAAFQAIKSDIPLVPAGGGTMNTYLDAINLQNLELTFKTVGSCTNKILNV